LLSLPALSARYPVWFCDVWGVVHNGERPMADTVAALRRHREAGGLVVLVTNSPRTAEGVIRQLDQIGVDPNAYDLVASSGDVTRALLLAEGGGKVFHLGPSRDLSIFEGLSVARVPLPEAHAVLCTGLFDDLTETPADYRDLLADILARGLTMICANPDRMVKKGDRLLWCAGALADDYENLGGRVVMAGKPHAPIYDHALALAERRLRRKLARSDILAIGDGLETDLKGAARYGLAALLVADGVSGAAESPASLLAEARRAAPSGEVVGAVLRLEWQEEFSTMQLIAGTAPFPSALRGGVVAIGNFDGLHRGHQRLLEVAEQEARRRGVPWGLVTFEPHPRSFFKPSEPVFRLTPAALKGRLAAALGAGFLVELTFDRDLSNLEPEDFVQRHLVERLGVAHVVTGYDFHFGRGRKGSPAVLGQLASSAGFGLTVVDQVTDDGDVHSPFSSSSIRQALRHGHMAEAASELGYHWTVMGEVVAGDQRGRTIGFPTANIVLDPGAEPFRGIYAVRVRDAAASGLPAWHGAGYFGDRPTFDSARTFLEVFLFDFEGDLYGRTLLVEFVALVRPDRRFASVAELTAQMQEDCRAAMDMLRLVESDNPLTAFRLGRLQHDGGV
jgi:riboflavin kinase/FMN adenylyltransferase